MQHVTRLFSALLMVGVVAFQAIAAEEGQLSAEEAAYREAIAGRAAKIVAQLKLDDAEHSARVTEIVALEYRTLRDIHDARDSALKQIDGKVADNSQAQRLKTEADANVVKAHRAFVARLGAELTADQVNQVKDGMTYGVVPITYAAYLELLPELTDEEKREIMANLLEARDYAMDAGSSDEKHAWFGKYKGRINNYLSAHGYDLKQAERDLAQRRNANE